LRSFAYPTPQCQNTGFFILKNNGVLQDVNGYARISTQDQNLDLQIEALTKAGYKKIFNDKMSDGAIFYLLI